MSAGDEKQGRWGVSIPSDPLFGHSSSKCVACWACVRQCPARALRIVGGHSEIITERCVKCGACASTCAHGARPVRSDLSRVRALLAEDRPVVLMLASEYIAALHPQQPHDAEDSLLRLGFASVETTVLGEELVASAYEQVHARVGSVPSLRSTCPVAIEWVRRFHPELTGALAPVIPPYIAQARLIRLSNPSRDVAIVYASPCWARKDEIFHIEFLGEIDAAIGFDELRALLQEAPFHEAAEPKMLRRPKASKQISAIDGFPFRTLRSACRTSGEVAAVRGLEDLERLLVAVKRGEACPSVIDMLACEGCLDGPCVNDELSVFMKRHIDARVRDEMPPPLVDSREFLSDLPAIDLIRSFKPQPAPKRSPSLEEVDRVLFAGEFFSRSETIDCGSCGYDTCVDHAAAICLGDSSWDMCFPLTRKRLDRERERCEREAVLDDLTGLLNKRAFHMKLAEEASRAVRYGTPLSLVIMDVDGFGRMNDIHGHSAGDKLLRAVGRVLDAAIRESDGAARIGGDEFALVLPNATKVEAWAVAEKVRTAVASLRIHVSGESRVSATASFGVASLSAAASAPQEMIAAAGGALDVAKAGGSDRVELAAG